MGGGMETGPCGILTAGMSIFSMYAKKDKDRLEEIDMLLSRSPLLQPAIDSGALILGPIQTTAFEFNNTYRGKRRIRDFTQLSGEIAAH